MDIPRVQVICGNNHARVGIDLEYPWIVLDLANVEGQSAILRLVIIPGQHLK